MTNNKFIKYIISKKIYFIVFSFIVLVGSIIVMACVSATTAIKSNNVSENGNSTTGHVDVKSDTISKASVDGSISINPDSPVAKQVQKREKVEQQKAINESGNFMRQQRVKSKDGEKQIEVPKSQEVDEFGNEVVTNNESNAKHQDNNSNTEITKTDGDSEANMLPPEPPAGLEGLESQSKRDQQKSEVDDQLKLLEYQNKLAAQRAKELSDKANILFGLVSYVPQPTHMFEVEKGHLEAPTKITSGAYTFQNPRSKHNNAALNGVGRTSLESISNSELSPKVDSKPKLLVQAGQSAYGHVTKPVNSDMPGPLEIQIDQGPFKGDIAYGNISIIDNDIGAQLTLDRIIHNGQVIHPNNVWILNPDTELSGFTDNVDHHYMTRVVALASGYFLSGFLDTTMDVTVVNTNSGTSKTSAAIDKLSDRLIYSTAKMANGFLPILTDAASRPITVKIFKNQGVLILFTDNVFENQATSKMLKPLDATNTQLPETISSNNTGKVRQNSEHTASDGLTLWQ